MKQVLMCGIACLGLLATHALSAEHSQLKAFPEAKKGMTRHVIVLPEKSRAEEVDFKVELFAGQVIETDGVNQMRMGCAVESRPLKGWGYTFYEVTGSAQTMGTLMAPAPGAKKVKAFVAGPPLLIRYNSRLPVVIYAPDGFEVRYRIWSAGTTSPISEG
jgi:ecotin